jgi:hypothetical protein
MKTKTATTIAPEKLEAARAFWAAIAKTHGWYKEPFYVQVWVGRDGEVEDSVSTARLGQDWVLPA